MTKTLNVDVPATNYRNFRKAVATIDPDAYCSWTASYENEVGVEFFRAEVVTTREDIVEEQLTLLGWVAR